MILKIDPKNDPVPPTPTLLFFYSVFGQIGVQLSLNEVTKGILIIMFL